MSEIDALQTEPGERLPDDTAVPNTHTDSRARRDELDVVPGQRLGRYLILDQLGRGGMGTVFHAHDEIVDRPCAVKLLHSGTAARHAQRLRREAQALAQLSHPNIVRVYEVGQVQGRWFIAMELVEGEPLGRWQRGSHGWPARVAAYLQAGEGLAAAHRAGFVHRDFKPDNCIIDREGRVRVLDFGLVRGSGFSFEESSMSSEHDVVPQDQSLTRTGAVLGTLAYMSLEQLNGRAVDARSDQFAFCVALYEALYGSRPFAGDSVGRLTVSLIQGAIRPAPKDTAVPERVRAIVLRGLSTDPDQRFPTMDDLLTALRRALSPRRRLGLVVAGVVTVGIVTVGWVGWPTSEPCSRAEALLEGVWDRARRDEVEAAFERTSLGYAGPMWTRVEPALDAYAQAWQRAHAEVCRATHVRDEQSEAVVDLRMRCLLQQRTALRETVGVLAEATPTRVQRASDLVASLPPLSRCDDIEALQARLPPPDDPQLARDVERLRDQLALARSLAAATEYDQALAEAERIDHEAQSLGYPPLQVEARYLRGNLRSYVGRYAEAEEDLEHAYFLAVEHGHEALALGAVLKLMFVAGHELGNPERGLSWSRTALALGRRGAEDPEFEAVWSLRVGTLLQDQGQVEQALEHFQRATKIWEQAQAAPTDIADALTHQGGALGLLDRHDEALDHYRRALTLWERAHGPRHPEVATCLNAIGIALEDKGQLDEALAHYRRSHQLWEELLGPDHPKVAGVSANIGNILSSKGELEPALERYEQALMVWERTLGAEHPQVGLLLSNIGGLLSRVDRLSEAVTVQRRSVAIIEASLGPEHPHLCQALGSLGEMLWRQGKLDEADEHLERSRQIGQATYGAGHMLLAQPLVTRAEVAVQRGDRASARRHVEHAITILDANDEAALQRAYAYFLLARILWPERAERAAARTAADESRRIYDELGERGRAHSARIAAWIANDGADPPTDAVSATSQEPATRPR